MQALEIAIDEIVVGDRFRKDLGDIETLAESIKEKGIIQPLSIDTKKNLLAGGRRLAAAKAAGLKLVPVVMREVSSELDSREIELIENINRKDMTWVEKANLEKKIFELKKAADPSWSLRKQGEALSQSYKTSHRRLELADVIETLPELADLKTEDEAWKRWKRLQEEVVVESLVQGLQGKELHDVTRFAKDHYKIGDALQMLKLVNAGTVTFAEVDPPYAIKLDKRKARQQDQDAISKYNEITADEYPNFVKKVATETFRILGESSFAVWWYGFEWYEEVYKILTSVGFKVSQVPGFWIKPGGGQTASPDTTLGSSVEAFFICRKDNPVLCKPGRSNAFIFDPVSPARKIHATERPVELIEEILDTFCFPRGRVLIPFLGSGATLRACYKKNLVGYGYDLDENIKRRFLARVEEDQLRAEQKVDDPKKRV